MLYDRYTLRELYFLLYFVKTNEVGVLGLAPWVDCNIFSGNKLSDLILSFYRKAKVYSAELRCISYLTINSGTSGRDWLSL